MKIETETERWAHVRALSVHLIKRGLQSGLSRFFGRAVRVALIYSEEPNKVDDFLVYDTTNLLEENKRAIVNYFSAVPIPQAQKILKPAHESVDFAPKITDSLICFGHQTDKLFYHLWLIEQVPSLSPSIIVDQWIQFAQVHLLHRPQDLPLMLFGGSERIIEHATFDVIREVIMRSAFPRTLPGGQLDAEIVLNSLLEIAMMKEESKDCSGSLSIYDRSSQQQPQVDFAFKNQIPLANHKHVRKLLSCTGEGYSLVAQSENVIGVSSKLSLKNSPLSVSFENGQANLLLKGEPLCYLINGHFRAVEKSWSINTLQNKKFDTLAISERKSICVFIDNLIAHARSQRYGFTLLIDFDDAVRRNLSGQILSTPVAVKDETFALIAGMCRVDGAVHMSAQSLSVYSFACLLDGEAADEEDLSRGARFNSARRFSNKASNMLVLVVSEDGPITIFEDGNPYAKIEKFIVDHDVSNVPPTFRDWSLT